MIHCRYVAASARPAGQPPPDLVLLHGWGLHGGIFQPLEATLARHAHLHLVDLPGHGHSPPLADAYIDTHTDDALKSVAAAVAQAVPENAIWLGWSLGGRVALAAALQGHVRRLALVGTTPCFVQRTDWPHGLPEAEFAAFAASLQQDWEATLQRFLALQTRGSAQERENLRTLRAGLFAHGRPQPEALAAGLQMLRQDLRDWLPRIHVPTCILHGGRDVLVPQAAAEALAAALPAGELRLLPSAGHAPFLSHADAFCQQLIEFLPAGQNQ